MKYIGRIFTWIGNGILGLPVRLKIIGIGLIPVVILGLALNYRDLDQRGKAIQSCQAAVASYKEIGATEMLTKAETLWVELQQ